MARPVKPARKAPAVDRSIVRGSISGIIHFSELILCARGFRVPNGERGEPRV